MARKTSSKRIAAELMMDIGLYHKYKARYYSFWVISELLENEWLSPSETEAAINLLAKLIDNPSNFHGFNVLLSKTGQDLLNNSKMVFRQINRITTAVPSRFVNNGQYYE
jgi:hypothetical protein